MHGVNRYTALYDGRRSAAAAAAATHPALTAVLPGPTSPDADAAAAAPAASTAGLATAATTLSATPAGEQCGTCARRMLLPDPDCVPDA